MRYYEHTTNQATPTLPKIQEGPHSLLQAKGRILFCIFFPSQLFFLIADGGKRVNKWNVVWIVQHWSPDLELFETMLIYDIKFDKSSLTTAPAVPVLPLWPLWKVPTSCCIGPIWRARRHIRWCDDQGSQFAKKPRGKLREPKSFDVTTTARLISMKAK